MKNFNGFGETIVPIFGAFITFFLIIFGIYGCAYSPQEDVQYITSAEACMHYDRLEGDCDPIPDFYGYTTSFPISECVPDTAPKFQNTFTCSTYETVIYDPPFYGTGRLQVSTPACKATYSVTITEIGCNIGAN